MFHKVGLRALIEFLARIEVGVGPVRSPAHALLDRGHRILVLPQREGGLGSEKMRPHQARIRLSRLAKSKRGQAVMLLTERREAKVKQARGLVLGIIFRRREWLGRWLRLGRLRFL